MRLRTACISEITRAFAEQAVTNALFESRTYRVVSLMYATFDHFMSLTLNLWCCSYRVLAPIVDRAAAVRSWGVDPSAYGAPARESQRDPSESLLQLIEEAQHHKLCEEALQLWIYLR